MPPNGYKGFLSASESGPNESVKESLGHNLKSYKKKEQAQDVGMLRTDIQLQIP